MEISKTDNQSNDSSKKVNENKSKILFKFKISDVTPKKNLYMGQCFVINLSLDKGKNIFQSKSIHKLNKLPPILLTDKNKLSNSLTLQRSQSQNKKYDLQFNPFKINKKKPKPLNSFDIYSSFEANNDLYTIQSEANNNFENDAFLKRINERYYPKVSKIKYFTRLFDDNDKNDLRMIDLKKIKGTNKKKNLQKKEIDTKYNFLYFRKNKNIKINTDEELNVKTNIGYKMRMEALDKKLKNFHNLKIKNCKNKVHETLNDLMKLKNKNSVFIENFKKSCDFKFDDDLLY